MSAQLKALPSPMELSEHRTMHGKTFLLPDGRIQVSTSLRAMHWDDNGEWIEVDETPRSEDGEIWTTRSTPYEMSWDSERLELDFRNKRGGEVKIRLVALDDVPIYRAISRAKVSGNSVKVFAAPELEIELRCRSHNVEILKILHGPNAPKRLTWEVTDVEPGAHAKLMDTTGRDNLLNSESRRRQSHVNRRRAVEILHSRSDGSGNAHRVTEVFTGRTRFIDPVTRARSWVPEVEWPVEIDVTVTVHVTADQDDGRSATGPAYWNINYINTKGYGGSVAGAFRFLSVNVPQGQTLDSATLTLNQTAHSGSQTATLSGENVDSASAWVNHSANGPLDMSATTANVSVAPAGSNGVVNITVTTIAQEIVNRAGWAANNNMRLGFTNVSAMTASYMKHEDLSAALGGEAVLTIVYTPAAGGGTFLLGQGCM